MKDDRKPPHISRRTFLSLSMLAAWPFAGGSPPEWSHLVGLSQEQKNRKQHVLTQKRPTTAGSIADAIVIKDDNLFFVAQPDGNVPLEGEHGFGLYYHDCRFVTAMSFGSPEY